MSAVNVKQFKNHANKKHVKTRTPYKVVEQYEKDFKGAFAKELGSASMEFVQTLSTFVLNDKSSNNITD